MILIECRFRHRVSSRSVAVACSSFDRFRRIFNSFYICCYLLPKMLPIVNEVLRRRINQQRNYELRKKRVKVRQNFDLSVLSEERFIELFRLNKTLFRQFVNILRPYLRQRKYITGVTVDQKILTALRFYATGCYQRSIGEDFNLGVSQTCVHRFVKLILLEL